MFTHAMERDKPQQEFTSGKVTINLMSKVEAILGHAGAMLSASKSHRPPGTEEHTIYWNACIFADDGTQVWFGDLDVTESADMLQKVANEIGTIHITPESPFRFEGLEEGRKQDKDCVITVKPDDD